MCEGKPEERGPRILSEPPVLQLLALLFPSSKVKGISLLKRAGEGVDPPLIKGCPSLPPSLKHKDRQLYVILITKREW